MAIIQTIIIPRKNDSKQSIDVYVMAEGINNDVAVYRHNRPIEAYRLHSIENLASDAYEFGYKLAEIQAREVMVIPYGKYYRR